MIDTHAHLDFPEFDQDREEVISRAFDSGVKKIVNIGVDLKRSRKSVEIAKAHEGIFASVGLHPDYFYDLQPTIYDIGKVMGELKELASHQKVVAIGETGLDYFSHSKIPITEEQKENQKKGFLAQIEMARERSLPVVVHCRNAWEDLHEIVNQKSKIKNQNDKSKFKNVFTKFVLHCYSGNEEDTEKFLKLPNVYFSFSGNITYPKPIERSEMLAAAVRTIPIERLMLDSDAPFLSPQEYRGKRNEPVYIRYIAEKIADIKKISVEAVERITDRNAKNFFGI